MTIAPVSLDVEMDNALDDLQTSNISPSPSLPQEYRSSGLPKCKIRLPNWNLFSNPSVFRLMSWFYTGVTKTLKDLNNLVHNVLLAPDFKLEDLTGFDASKEVQKIDKLKFKDDEHLPNGWMKASLSIPMPCSKVSFPSEADAPKFEVQALYYRKLVDVIKSAFEEHSSEDFHITPFAEYWQPQPDVPPEQLEVVVAGIMLWSDSTHLISFGNASLWPIYLYIGNLSKYAQAKPSMFAAHHLAYIPKLDDAIQDEYKLQYGKLASPEVLAHLRQEVIQAVWFLLLDDEFMEAYENGIVLEFSDGILRRLFPRFFIYSADYPEKYAIILT
ncbi:hypothetical protein BDQ17DRAFT_1432346 [Cyathus striatus]|nr:hypothetical protein BDQ17DRAFT_1432346 [Cyathus striatus]